MNECTICFNELLDETCITECNHRFCKECLDKWLDSNKSTCPLCRDNINYFDYKGKTNRIVRIIQREREEPVRRNINTSLMVINKKCLNILVGGTVFSLLSLTTSLYFLFTCGNFIND